MTTVKQVRRQLADLRARVERAARQASQSGVKGSRINRTGRTNIVVARNIGQPGSTERATAHQSAVIRQNGKEK